MYDGGVIMAIIGFLFVCALNIYLSILAVATVFWAVNGSSNKSDFIFGLFLTCGATAGWFWIFSKISFDLGA